MRRRAMQPSTLIKSAEIINNARAVAATDFQSDFEFHERNKTR